MTSNTLTIRLPMPHAGQRMVDRELKRFNVLCCGRRWRKTTFGVSLAVRRSLAGQQIIWGAPTYKQCDVAWAEFKKAVSGIFSFHAGKMEITAPGGGKIFLRSMDNPDNSRGLSAHGALFDETADCVEEAWTEVIRPMLIDTQGWALFKGTPKGRNWFYHLFQDALTRPDGAAWQIPTLGCELRNGILYRKPHPYENPDIPFAELENMLYGDRPIPERVFRQEILAEFIEDAGGVFHHVDGCIGGALLEKPANSYERYIMGVDLAKHQDYTVCVVMNERTRQVVGFHRFNQHDWPTQKKLIFLIAKHWNNAQVWVDSTGVGDPIYDDLAYAGMQVFAFQIATNLIKRQLIDNLIVLIEQQGIHYPNIPVLIDELKSYEYERLPAGALRMNAPKGQHDDCVIALALACWPLAHISHAPIAKWYDDVLADPRHVPSSASGFGGLDLLDRRM